MISNLAHGPYIDALRACRRVLFVGSLNGDREVPGTSALAAASGVRASGEVGMERVVATAASATGPWAELENLPNLERYAITWPRMKLSAHDESVGHFGPFHLLWPLGSPDRAQA